MKKNQIVTLSVISALILIVGIVGALMFLQGNQAISNYQNFIISAKDSTPYGTSVDTVFTIQADEVFDEVAIRNTLSISPNISYDITHSGDGIYIIDPKEQLEAGTTYTLTLASGDSDIPPRSRSFTTYSEFLLLDTVPQITRYGHDVTFSFNAPPQDIEKHVTIQPPVAGEWSYHGTNAVFSFTDIELMGTHETDTFTVTIKSGLTSRYGMSLAEDFTIDIEPYNQPAQVPLNIYNDYQQREYAQTFMLDEHPYIRLQYSGDGKGYVEEDQSQEISTDINIYRLDSYEDYLYYLQMLSTSNSLPPLPSTLELASNHQTIVDTGASIGDGLYYIPVVMPETLPHGHYIMALTASTDDATKDIYKLVQVSPYSYFHQTFDGETLLWLNDTVTGQPISDTPVTFTSTDESASDIVATTDKNGLVHQVIDIFDPDEEKIDEYPYYEEYYYYYYMSNDGFVLVDEIGETRGIDDSMVDDVYAYLYTDRNIYQPNDTIAFWGIVNPRYKDSVLPDTLNVGLFDGNTAIFSQSVELAEDGTFSGSIQLDNTVSSYYSLVVSGKDIPINEEFDRDFLWDHALSRVYMEVKEYQKPDFTFSSSYDKPYYNWDDTINITTKIGFYDGTPMENRQIIVDGDEIITSDENGEATYSTPASGRYYSWHPQYIYTTFNNYSAEDAPFSFGTYTQYFPSDMMLLDDVEVVDDSTTLSLFANHIDLTNLAEINDYAKDDYALIKGLPYEGINFDINIERNYYTKEVSSKYYDPYTMQTLYTYHYSWQSESYASFQKQTDENGMIVIEDLPLSTAEVSYSANIFWTDTKGNGFDTTVYLGDMHYSPFSKDDDNAANMYHLNLISENYTGEQYNYSTYFTIDDTINVELKNSNQPVTVPENGRMLLTASNDKLREYTVVDSNVHSFDIDDNHLPSINMMGAYFDGKYIYPINISSLRLSSDDTILDIHLSPDKDMYLPNEEATLDVLITKPDGTPASNTPVAIGFVDEAIFALSEQNLEVFTDYYNKELYPTTYISGWSYRQMISENYYGEGGKGGGGDSGGALTEPRENFVDSLGIFTAITDSNGRASITLNLPENLSSWRFTAVAISDKYYVGSTTRNIQNTLPYYVKPIVSSNYLTGDEIGVALRSFGNELEDNEEITYTVSIENTNYTETATATGKNTVDIVLPPLPAGEYNIVVSGEANGKADAVKLPFSVLETTAEVPIFQWVDLASGEQLPTVTRTPVFITLYNKDYDMFFRALDTIRYDNSDRNDVIKAQEIAEILYSNIEKGILPAPLTSYDHSLYPEDLGKSAYDQFGTPLFGSTYNDIFYEVQSNVLSYINGTDVHYSYEMLNFINSKKQKHYSLSYDELSAMFAFWSLYNSTDENPDMDCYNFYYDLLSSSGELSTQGRLYLIMAVYAFDSEKATEMYKTDIIPLLKTDNDGDYIPAEGALPAVELTSDALMTAILIDYTDIDTDELVRYITEKQTSIYTRGRCALPLTAYAITYQPKPSNPPTVSYMLGGEEISLTLDVIKPTQLVLTQAEYDALDLTVTSGEPMATVKYTGDFLENAFEPTDGMTISREVTPLAHLGTDTYLFSYSVTLSNDIPSGMYTLVDFIPSNMRLLPESSYTDYSSYRTTDYSDQQITMYDFYDKDYDAPILTFEYRAQTVLDSTARYDDVFVYNNATNEGVYIKAERPENTPELITTSTTDEPKLDNATIYGENAYEKRDINAEHKNEYVSTVADTVLAEIITEGMSDIEKLRAVYDYIITNTYFTAPIGTELWQYRSSSQNPPTYVETRALSPMLFGLGTCEDYASAFVVLARKLGFESEYVFGLTVSLEGDYIDHAWAVVKVDDEWYHVDPQLEDDVIRNDIIKNRYFMRSDAVMIADHRWGENLISYWGELDAETIDYIRSSLTPPACTGNIAPNAPTQFIKSARNDKAQLVAEIEAEKAKHLLENPDFVEAVPNYDPPLVINP